MLRAPHEIEHLLLTEYRRLSAAEQALVQQEAARLRRVAEDPFSLPLSARPPPLRRRN